MVTIRHSAPFAWLCGILAALLTFLAVSSIAGWSDSSFFWVLLGIVALMVAVVVLSSVYSRLADRKRVVLLSPGRTRHTI